MARNNPGKSNIRKFSCGGLLLATLVLTAVTFALSADDRQIETIDATAMGINKEGQLEFQLNQNPWKLLNIIDWNKAGQLK